MIWMWMKSLCLSLSEVIKELDEIKLFLNNGCAREASAVTSAVDMVTSLHIPSMKQTTLHDYKINYFEDVSQIIIIVQLLVYS